MRHMKQLPELDVRIRIQRDRQAGLIVATIIDGEMCNEEYAAVGLDDCGTRIGETEPISVRYRRDRR
jgi:hypothetical protein